MIQGNISLKQKQYYLTQLSMKIEEGLQLLMNWVMLYLIIAGNLLELKYLKNITMLFQK